MQHLAVSVTELQQPLRWRVRRGVQAQTCYSFCVLFSGPFILEKVMEVHLCQSRFHFWGQWLSSLSVRSSEISVLFFLPLLQAESVLWYRIQGPFWWGHDWPAPLQALLPLQAAENVCTRAGGGCRWGILASRGRRRRTILYSWGGSDGDPVINFALFPYVPRVLSPVEDFTFCEAHFILLNSMPLVSVVLVVLFFVINVIFFDFS